MADELKDVLLGGLEAKTRGFASEDFVGGYRRAVVGRVKRRRAVSATAVGGASVLGVGAVAVGAGQVPWAHLGLGVSPGSSSGVVCTTTTPDAVVGDETSVPAGVTFAVLENATNDVVFIGWERDSQTPFARGRDGSVERLASVDGHAEYVFPSGTTVIIWPDGVEHAKDFTVMPVDQYRELASTAASVASEGTVVARPQAVPDGAAYFVADTTTGVSLFVGWVNGENRAWDTSGAEVDLTILSGTTPGLVLPSGITLALDPEDGPPLASDTELVRITPIGDVTTTWVLLANGGTQIGTVVYDGTALQFVLTNGDVYDFTQPWSAAEEEFGFKLPDGSSFRFTFDGTELAVVAAGDSTVGLASESPAPEPSSIVTCVISTPEPSDSGSPSASPMPTVSTSPISNPSTDDATASAVTAGSTPFQCGYEFASETGGGDSVWINEVRWLSSEQASDEILAMFSDPDDHMFDLSGADVPVADVWFSNELIADGGTSNTVDPAELDWATIGFSSETAVPSGFAIGADFVLVADGRAVATARSEELRQAPIYWKALASDISPLYLLNAETAFEGCAGVASSTLAEAQIYAVAGVKTLFGDEQFGPVYAWKKVAPQDK